MLLKWIVCDVGKDKQTAFSVAQQQWTAIKAAPGFITQLGGWVSESGNACILGLWKNHDSYKHFMEEIHDTVTVSNKQAVTYSKISTTLFDQQFIMPGSADSLQSAARHADFIRVADCTVKPELINTFINKQSSIWKPGMQKAKGMLGGAFWKSVKSPNNFLVSTFWNSKKHNSSYEANILPLLRKQAQALEEINQLTGYTITVEPSWTI